MTLSQSDDYIPVEELVPSESIARQKLMLLKERCREPELFVPVRDYSQKQDEEEDVDNPNLQLFMQRLSSAALGEWVRWTEELDEDQIVKMLLSDEEYKEYQEYSKIVQEEEEEYLEQEHIRVSRRCSETSGFHRTVPAELTDSPYSISFEEMLFRNVVTDYQTNIWRVPYASPASDLGFLDPMHDPDFLPPSSVAKGFLIKPASRPYNLTFFVKYEHQDKEFEKICKPKSDKDYTTVEDIKYLIEQNGGKPVEIKDITPSEEIQWELDLRLSPRNGVVDGQESLIPNARDYKKIDNKSKLGRRLIRSLKENPYHEWVEVSWEYENEKKVALVRTSKDFLVWCYVDRSSLVSNKKRRKVTYPQTTPIQMRAVNGSLFTVGYSIRYQDYQYLPNPYNFLVKRELDCILSRLIKSNYILAHRSEQDLSGCVTVTLVNENLKTAKQRYLARN